MHRADRSNQRPAGSPSRQRTAAECWNFRASCRHSQRRVASLLACCRPCWVAAQAQWHQGPLPLHTLPHINTMPLDPASLHSQPAVRPPLFAGRLQAVAGGTQALLVLLEGAVEGQDRAALAHPCATGCGTQGVSSRGARGRAGYTIPSIMVAGRHHMSAKRSARLQRMGPP